MARLRVIDKVGLGHFVLSAAHDKDLKEKLFSAPERFLKAFVEELPAGHKVHVVAEDENTTVLVLPAVEGIPRDADQIEAILRDEARQYEEARERVDESKQKRPGEERPKIPEPVLRNTYALMIGNTALSPTSRALPRAASRLRAAD